MFRLCLLGEKQRLAKYKYDKSAGGQFVSSSNILRMALKYEEPALNWRSQEAPLELITGIGTKINPKNARLYKESVVFLGLLFHRSTIESRRNGCAITSSDPIPEKEIIAGNSSILSRFLETPSPSIQKNSYVLSKLMTQSDPSRKNYVKLCFEGGHLIRNSFLNSEGWSFKKRHRID